MSVVMRVHVKFGPGPGFNAILKLFDRRFGQSLRQGTVFTTEPLDHTAAKETLFQESVRSGGIGSVLDAIEEESRTRGFAVSCSDDVDGTAEGYVLYEADIWQTCEGYFDRKAIRASRESCTAAVCPCTASLRTGSRCVRPRRTA